MKFAKILTAASAIALGAVSLQANAMEVAAPQHHHTTVSEQTSATQNSTLTGTNQNGVDTAPGRG